MKSTSQRETLCHTRDSGGADRLDLEHLDEGLEPSDLARVEAAAADLERRGGARRDSGPQRLLGRALRDPRREIAGQHRVPRSCRGKRLERWDPRVVAPRPPLLADERERTAFVADEDVA